MRKENQEFRGFFPPFFRATVDWYSSCFPSTGGKVKGRDRLHFSVSPALAVGEAQVHAVTGEEGASIQRELHAGWVWDGLTQQGHDSACRGRRRAAAKGTNVACAVEDLEKEGEEFKAEFINQARFKQPK